jgi:flagellin
MARINTNIASMIAQSNLGRTNQDLHIRLERLSTGLRINRGADDPAGLIVSERLRSEIRGLEQAVKNAERAGSVIATAEGYLAEVADMLNSIKALTIEAANSGGVSAEEIAANQLQVDSAIESITRISNTASFNGLQLLNGSLEYRAEGIDAADILAARIHSVYFGNNSEVNVGVTVLEPAERAQLFVEAVDPPVLSEDLTLEIAGNEGVQTLSFIAGTTYEDVVAAVNSLKDSTGVQAVLFDGDADEKGLRFESIGYGSSQFVSVKAIGENLGGFTTHDAEEDGEPTTHANGIDVNAIVNGNLAQGDGLKIKLNSSTLSLELTLSEAFGTVAGSSEFTITGGGANFQLGPRVNANQQVGFGVPSIAASRLGGTVIDGVLHHLDSLKSGQPNSLIAGNALNASKILEEAITEISVIRGRLGAFERNTVQTSARALQIGIENISASESLIRDADFARETAALTRAQILTQAGTSVLATANVNAQNVLALLG